MSQRISVYAEAVAFLKKRGTKAAVRMGCEGFFVFIDKKDLIAQLERLDENTQPGFSIRFSDYDGEDASGGIWIENNILHFDSSVVIPQG